MRFSGEAIRVAAVAAVLATGCSGSESPNSSEITSSIPIISTEMTPPDSIKIQPEETRDNLFSRLQTAEYPSGEVFERVGPDDLSVDTCVALSLSRQALGELGLPQFSIYGDDKGNVFGESNVDGTLVSELSGVIMDSLTTDSGVIDLRTDSSDTAVYDAISASSTMLAAIESGDIVNSLGNEALLAPEGIDAIESSTEMLDQARRIVGMAMNSGCGYLLPN